MEQIAVHGNVMVLGISKSKGAVYIFLRKNNVWVESKKIQAPEEAHKFGNKVALWENHVLVSSWYNAYFYEMVQGPASYPCITAKADGTVFDNDCVRCDPFVAIDGDTAVISKDKESLQILSGIDKNFGNVSLFDGLDKHNFGGVAISDNVVVAGAPNINDKNGSVSVYQKASAFGSEFWFEYAQLSPNIVSPRENFGDAVDIDGNVIVVGAYDYRDNRGSAYIFRRNETNPWSSWIQEAKLLPDDPQLRSFGRSVSINDNTIAVGDSTYNNSSGAVFVYTYDPLSKSWSQMNETITNHDCEDHFGSGLALSRENGLFVGCPGEQRGTGAVFYYIQAKSGDHYVLQQKIESLEGYSNDNFGAFDQISVDDNLVVIGTETETNGTVHIFANTNNAWLEVLRIESPPAIRQFGYKVAISGKRVLVSSISNVYSYTLDEC